MAHQKVPVLPAILTTVLAAALAAPTANADESHQFQVAFSDVGVYPRSATSMAADKVGEALADGTTVTVVCETTGESVANGYTTPSNVWAKLDNGTYVPNSYLYTGVDGRTPGVLECKDKDITSLGSEPAQEQTQARNATSYNPEAAKAWAKHHWNDHARYGENNCTWFASQVLWNGGLAKTDEWTDYSMDYGGRMAPIKKFFGHRQPTSAAIVADHLYQYLIKNGNEKRDITWSDNTAAGASVGDLIFYDLKINGQYDIDHVAVVTGFTEDGYPLVTQHGQDEKPWSWGEKDGNVGWVQDVYRSDGWGEPRAYLIKITQ